MRFAPDPLRRGGGDADDGHVWIIAVIAGLLGVAVGYVAVRMICS